MNLMLDGIFFCLSHQAYDEPLNEFLTHAKTKLKFCNFDTLNVSKLLAACQEIKLFVGLKRIQPELTLNKAIQIFKIAEQVIKQLREINQSVIKTVQRVEKKKVVNHKIVENKNDMN